MPTYPNSVPTLHEKYNVPAILGTIDLHRRIEKGAELDVQNLNHAQATAVALRGFLELGLYAEFGLNEEVVIGAELRAKAIENMHANLQYSPGTSVLQALQALRDDILAVNNNRQVLCNNVRNDNQVLLNEIRLVRSETSNAMIRTSNRLTPTVLAPVRKVIPDSGLQQAHGLIAAADENLRQALDIYEAAHPAPAIGTTPPVFLWRRGKFTAH